MCQAPRCVLRGERRERLVYGGEIVRGKQLLRVQHLGMRDRGTHVVRHEPLIECMVLACGVLEHPRIEWRTLVP